MEREFSTISVNRSTVVEKEGIEIKSYIAGVNSGSYELPFVISVRTWAKKFWFKKFFTREIYLGYFEIRELRDELNKVITYLDEQRKNQ